MKESQLVRLSDIEQKLNNFISRTPVARPTREKTDETSPYILAAAVLVFYHPDTIQPIFPLDPVSNKDALTVLLRHSELVMADNDGQHSPQKNTLHYLINEETRKKALVYLSAHQLIHQAIEANRNAEKDLLIQEMFYQVLQKEQDFRLQEMGIEALNSLLRIAEWVQLLGILPYTTSQIVHTILVEEMLLPFRHLTGTTESGKYTEHFRGRKEELSKLRAYVNIAASETILEGLHRYIYAKVENIFDWSKKPPLLIFGMGGIGKSTLLAKFILDHYATKTANNFPYVYLDFDRANLNALQPESLLVEAARQLSVQYPENVQFGEKCRSFLASWSQLLLVENLNTTRLTIQDYEYSKNIRTRRMNIHRDFSDLLQQLSDSLGKPFLVVIDTFEEVQYKGAGCVKTLYDFFESLQSYYPLMRVVIAGRAPVTNIKTEQIELGELDREASRAFLANAGVVNGNDRKKIVEQVGGNPLSLKLAASLVAAHGMEVFDEIYPDKKSGFWEKKFRTNSTEIQGILYQRILQHIHDPRVRQIAHPGLVLREITPELIWQVLKDPCELPVKDLEEATELLKEMGKEVSLVKKINSHTLRHRADVRKVMLKLIHAEKPEAVFAIHQRAIEYFETGKGIKAHAEAMYHRLCLDQSPRELDAFWSDAFAPYLMSNIEDYPVRAQGFLSGRTGYLTKTEDELFRSAESTDSLRLIIRQAAELINAGYADEVLDMIHAIPDWPENGILHLFQVRALLLLNQKENALQVVIDRLQSYYSEQLDPNVMRELREIERKLTSGQSFNDETGFDEQQSSESSFDFNNE